MTFFLENFANDNRSAGTVTPPLDSLHFKPERNEGLTTLLYGYGKGNVTL
jgi:hypothetical protein